MDLELKLTQTGNTIIRLNKIGNISNSAYDELMRRNEETLAMLHEKACTKAEPSNENAVLPINSVIARLFIVLFAVVWSSLLAVMLISFIWLPYWIVSGRNIMIDSKLVFDKVRAWLNVL